MVCGYLKDNWNVNNGVFAAQSKNYFDLRERIKLLESKMIIYFTLTPNKLMLNND